MFASGRFPTRRVAGHSMLRTSQSLCTSFKHACLVNCRPFLQRYHHSCTTRRSQTVFSHTLLAEVSVPLLWVAFPVPPAPFNRSIRERPLCNLKRRDTDRRRLYPRDQHLSLCSRCPRWLPRCNGTLLRLRRPPRIDSLTTLINRRGVISKAMSPYHSWCCPSSQTMFWHRFGKSLLCQICRISL